MKLRNLTRTFNYLSPQQKLVTAIAAVVGGGVLLCIPLLSLQPPRPSASVGGDSSGAPIGASNPSGGDDSSGADDSVSSQAPPLDTANPIDIPSDSSTGSNTGTGLGSDSSTSGSSTNSLTGSSNSTLDTTDPLDERVGNQQRSSAPLNDTLSGNVDSPYSQSASRYQSPSSTSKGSYSASPGGSSLSTVYSRSAGGSGSSMSGSSSQSSNLQPAQGNNFTYLNPFSPNSGAGTTNASPSGTNLPANTSAVPSQSAIAPSGLTGTGQNGMNAAPSNGSSGGFTPPTAATTPANPPSSQNSSFTTPSFSPGNTPNQ